MTWTVYLTRKAHKQLKKLPQTIQDLADLAVTDLETEGINPQGWDTLKTDDDEYRLRLNVTVTECGTASPRTTL